MFSQGRVRCTSEQTLVEETQMVAGGPNNAESSLDTGDHIFSFTFTLPVELPASFQGKHGQVKLSFDKLVNSLIIQQVQDL